MRSLVCLVVILVYSVWGWGQEGHKVVSVLASNRLTPAASKAVNTLLGGKSIADVCTIADDYRSGKGSWSAPMHYVNVPKGATQFSMQYCPGLCVVKAVQNYTKLVASGIDTPSYCDWNNRDKEPCPLEFLIHFLQDLHQPLHVGYAEDQGGNLQQVNWFGKSTNLHSVWDSDILGRWDAGFTTAAQKIEDLLKNDAKFRQQVTVLAAISDPVQIAEESFQYVLSTVYDFKSNGNVGILDEAYYQKSLPVIQLRLATAGLRLANSINNSIKKSDV